MTRIRGVVYRDADDAYDAAWQEALDAEAEAKRAASGLSPDELSLIDAGNQGRKAGMLGHGASMNPYDHESPEYAEWDKHRLATIAARLAGKLAA